MVEPHWPTVAELLGREPTDFETDLSLFMIRTGHAHEVWRVLTGQRICAADAIRSVYPISDTVVEFWDQLDKRHQDALRDELKRLLWRIEGEKLRGSYQEAANAILAEQMGG